jgi:hypothetical protein
VDKRPPSRTHCIYHISCTVNGLLAGHNYARKYLYCSRLLVTSQLVNSHDVGVPYTADGRRHTYRFHFSDEMAHETPLRGCRSDAQLLHTTGRYDVKRVYPPNATRRLSLSMPIPQRPDFFRSGTYFSDGEVYDPGNFKGFSSPTDSEPPTSPPIETKTYASLPPSPISPSPPPSFLHSKTALYPPPFSIWDYLREELLATDFDSHQELKWERVSNFLSIPVALEKVRHLCDLVSAMKA